MSSKAELLGPVYFNELLNLQDLDFMDKNGVSSNTTVYAAAQIAEEVASGLLGRVNAQYTYYHYNAGDRKDLPGDAKRFSDEFGKLDELFRRINGLIIHLEQGAKQFDSSKTMKQTAVISSVEDLRLTTRKLKIFASSLQKNHLTKGTISWYLKDYINWFNDRATKV